MSNSKYMGLWKTNFGDNILQIHEGPESELKWKWVKWHGNLVAEGDKLSYIGDCLNWRPCEKEGYTRIYEFKEYLKKL